MSVQKCCCTSLLVLLALFVIPVSSTISRAAARSPSDATQQLNTAQQAELKKAVELNNQVIALYGQARYSDATVIAKQVLKIRENVLGAEHSETAGSLNNLAMLYETQGDYSSAMPLYRRALKIKENVFGPEHPETALSLNNLAGLLRRQSQFDQALPLLERALTMREKVLGRTHPDTAVSLNNLAFVYESLGRFADARPLYQRVLKIREEVLGPEHPATANILQNLSLLNISQGNDLAALPFQQRALMIREKVLGPEHPDTAQSLNNLALIYDAQGRFADAEPLYQRALTIYEKVLGPTHPDTAQCLNNLAFLYDSQGNTAAALTLYNRALKINEQVLGGGHLATALTLNNLAALYRNQGNDVDAEPLYQRALTIRKAALGDNHPDTAISYNNLAVTYQSQGKGGQAISAIDHARKGLRTHVSQVLPALSAVSQEKFLQANYTDSFHIALSIALSHAADPNHTALSAAWLINGKAVAQDALAQRNLLMRDIADPKSAPIVKELLDVRAQLAAVAMNAAEAGKAEERQTKLAVLTAREQQLASQLNGGSSDATTEWIELRRIRNALPANSVLIDIVRFNRFDYAAQGLKSRWRAPRYAAWKTSPNGQADTVLIDLGDARIIDELVQKARRQISSGAARDGSIAKDGEEAATKQLSKDLAALAKLIWQPLAPHVGDAKNIILSPDGALWLAPWSALPVGAAGDEYLLERYNLRLIVSGRDLVKVPDGRATNPPVILANPDFDQQESQKKSAIKGIFKTLPPENENVTRSFSAKSTLPKVKPLPNTGFEAVAIRPHIETYTGQVVGLYKEQYALEQVAKDLHGPQIATFATHGFFLPKQQTKREDRNTFLSNNTRAETVDTEGEPIENPLLRCGLLLSGCNNPDASVADDDGILTGMEIVGIDFRGTELVVLSACETGIGDVRHGEGVAGLRQAFQLAGAEAVLATLWQIPDRESAILMSSFFRHLAADQPKAEALRLAQIELIEKRRSRYGAAHPFYWAAFTLTGK